MIEWPLHREVPKKKTAEEMEEDRRLAEEEAKAPPKGPYLYDVR